MSSNIEIFCNKKKVLPFVLGSIVFVLAAIFLLYVTLLAKSPIALKIFVSLLAFTGILFFGLIVLVMLPKLFTSNPALIISEDGLIDNTSGVSVGLILWSEIKKIKYQHSGNNTFLVPTVKNPTKFINSQKNPIKKMAIKINNKISGTPIHVLVSILDIDLSTLNSLIYNKKGK